MGREIRRVPPGWEHPRRESGDFQPMHDEGYYEALDALVENETTWRKGEHPDQTKWPEDTAKYKCYAEWNGGMNDPEWYRPDWTPEQATHYQLYENVTEGTPLSPVFPSIEALGDWLLSEGYSPEAVAAFTRSRYVPSMVMVGGRFYEGIEAAGILAAPESSERPE